MKQKKRTTSEILEGKEEPQEDKKEIEQEIAKIQ